MAQRSGWETGQWSAAATGLQASMPFELIAGGAFCCTPAWRLDRPIVADAHRLYFIRRGSARLELDGRGLTLRGNQLVFAPAMRLLRYECPRRMDLHWLHFRCRDGATDVALSRIARPLTWPLRQLRLWSPVWRRLDDVFAAGGPEPRLLRQTQAMVMYLVAEALASASALTERQAPALPADLAAALQYMEQHHLRNPSLAQIATLVHRCPGHFHRQFRRALGISPFAYMLRLRMRLARDLLGQGRWNVTQVADHCGYANVFYFSRVFRRYHGQPPSACLRGAMSASP